ncbi:hypothetical protein FRX31_007506 [Thalictrum thalictroides]|uniref:Prolamin-like domain-containing protein n=1 Tax=Thalictrum thalictroides TaxID=46969 RepID=A0A7J6X291_THATH|nr:hypothetical protein FRX31_025547 [Thalictrum thalictroides]KAF5202908.1 hypothetical protein FRX31_007506 [Thalictrum thalictroides]
MSRLESVQRPQILPPEPASLKSDLEYPDGPYADAEKLLADRKNGVNGVSSDDHDDKGDINRYCCGEIMVMGKQCHDGFVSTLARIDKYREFWSVLPKSGEWLWNYCQKIGGEKRKNEPSPPVRNGGKKPPLPGKGGNKSP